ncbi:hypothetical protein QBC46DRAFT_325715 [Diplogelasinospora grovesii]|uniref:Uncharacterized protein n=1 Tax=Diplogelasinospora grovesii TaxID=303347 RepID=A0AAN6MV60_9PEZI|nr:hypothetical protein QBC46DRAFT_325715 [Diplogelasinospora grovesii]
MAPARQAANPNQAGSMKRAATANRQLAKKSSLESVQPLLQPLPAGSGCDQETSHAKAQAPGTLYALVARLIRWCFGSEVEVPKVIIHRKSIWRALWKCAIHFVPIAVGAILVALNLQTYFIGAEFQGYNDGYWQAFDRWALQLAAKLEETLIVASLATILMDVLRDELLSGSNGLPLGIVTAKTLFANGTLLISPGFWNAIGGSDWWKKKKRCFLSFLIVTCSVLALVAGLSTALLLIPKTYSDWSAGGSTFHLAGTNDIIWPSKLDGQSIGGAHCQSTDGDLSLQQFDESRSCIWAGYETMLQWFKTTPRHRADYIKRVVIQDGETVHPADYIRRVIIQDGNIQRRLLVRPGYNSSVAVFGVNVAACAYSNVLASIWRAAVFVGYLGYLGIVYLGYFHSPTTYNVYILKPY